MTAPNHLFVVEGGDPSLAASAQRRKEAGITQSDSDAQVLHVYPPLSHGRARRWELRYTDGS